MSRRPPYKLYCACGALVELDPKFLAKTPYSREALLLRAARKMGWLWRGGAVSGNRAECVCPTCSGGLRVLRLEGDSPEICGLPDSAEIAPSCIHGMTPGNCGACTPLT